MANADDLAQARVASTRATNQLSNMGEDVRALEHRLERLALVNKAMWTLLRTKLGLTDIELRSMILEIDAADGAIDGRLGPQTQVCTGCGRNIAAKFRHCQYCDTEIKQTDPFRV
jgi:hypothetical protein